MPPVNKRHSIFREGSSGDRSDCRFAKPSGSKCHPEPLQSASMCLQVLDVSSKEINRTRQGCRSQSRDRVLPSLPSLPRDSLRQELAEFRSAHFVMTFSAFAFSRELTHRPALRSFVRIAAPQIQGHGVERLRNHRIRRNHVTPPYRSACRTLLSSALRSPSPSRDLPGLACRSP